MVGNGDIWKLGTEDVFLFLFQLHFLVVGGAEAAFLSLFFYFPL